MARNTKVTSPKVASAAGRALANPGSSKVQRKLAGAALAQTVDGRETGEDMEAIASRALDNPRSAAVTKQLAGSILSQSNKKR